MKMISPETFAALRLMSPRAVRHVTLLPDPGLADDAERLSAVDLEREPVDGLDDPVGRGELDSEVADLEQCLAHRHYEPAAKRLTNTSRAGRGRRTGCPRRDS